MRAEAQWLLLSCGVIIGGLLWAVVGYEAGVDLLRTTGLVVAAGGVGMFLDAINRAEPEDRKRLLDALRNPQPFRIVEGDTDAR